MVNFAYITYMTKKNSMHHEVIHEKWKNFNDFSVDYLIILQFWKARTNSVRIYA